MVFIISLVHSSEVSALFYVSYLTSFAALTPSLQGGFAAAVFVFLARTAAARIVASDF
jgi:hypothetical protein